MNTEKYLPDKKKFKDFIEFESKNPNGTYADFREYQVSEGLQKEMRELEEINENLFDLSIDYRSDKIIEARNNIYAAIRELGKATEELNTNRTQATAVPMI